MTNEPIKFGTDGIRSVAGQYPLDPESVLLIGRALGRWLRANEGLMHQVLIGEDTRQSSDEIASQLTRGLMAEGINVYRYGVRTTPETAFLSQFFNNVGIMVTASHNPFEQNGIKVFGPDGFKLTDDQESQIEALIADKALVDAAPAIAADTWANRPVQGLYAQHLLPHLQNTSQPAPIPNNLTVVLDCANGAASAQAESIFTQAGATTYTINAQPNGVNINVNAGSEHVRRDRSALLAAIHEHKADVGIAFDGDADRVVFVTPDGMLIDGDHILGILAVQMQSDGTLPNDTVVATDMSNSGLEYFLSDHEIRLERTKVGDRYVMERLRTGGFVLGGEQAGHVILLDETHTAGDGIYVGLLVAALIAKNKQHGGSSLSELAKAIPRYPQVIASAHLASRFDLKSVPGLADLTDQTLAAFDGKGRDNLRFSGTEPNLLRAMVEGGPGNSLDDVVGRALALCKLVAAHTANPDPHIDIVDCVTGAPVQLKHN